MPNYDINDPYDIDIMNYEFDSISSDKWEEYIDIAIDKKLGFKSIGILKKSLKKAGLSKYMSSKEIKWVLSIVEDIEKIIDDDARDAKSTELMKTSDFVMPKSNLTLRVAWHDNRWNGTVCKDPLNNTYCNGFNSLLSERIRKRKDESIDKEIENRGKHLSDIDYVPPCFWSVNLFGEKAVEVEHDNPAAPNLKMIKQELPANSILSWPFAVSFTRTQKEQKESGAYPKNLEQTRIPRFSAKIKENRSIAFMYAKFSNPLTEEEGQYLVVGAGLVDDKEKADEIKHFGPKSEIEKIREKPYSNYKNRNFPSMNWAMRFSFDDYSTVRMPYHEYLEQAENMEDKDGFLNKIKVAITEPELEWCFKYVAMDIGDDEAIYILTKMRKALVDSKNDGVVSRDKMLNLIEKIDGLLEVAWDSRSYFPGFVSVSRALLDEMDEPDFPLEKFYEDFKIDIKDVYQELKLCLSSPNNSKDSKKYADNIYELTDKLEQYGFSIDQFLKLSMLNLKPFQFKRILSGKLKLSDDWINSFDDNVKRSHDTAELIENPYLIYEDYEYWTESHDDVYGEELDSPIDLFKIDIAYFPHSKFQHRIDFQREMSFKDKRRVRAIILRYLKTLENSGNCFADAKLLQDAMESYPLYYEIDGSYKLPQNFFHPIESEYSNHFQDERNKLVLLEANDTTYYYLNEIYSAEKNIEKKISELLNGHKNTECYFGIEDYIDNSISTLKKHIGVDFDENSFKEERVKLYDNIFKEKLFIVSGSAGSGKSYEILNIISYLEKKEKQKYLLLAPTGKAALRLSSDKDFQGIKASTIDKFIADVTYKKISQSEIRQFNNLIIDEMSMVDLLKFEKLLNIFNFKEPSFKRLIIIGDPNQLPAIGYGRVLADLISYLKTSGKYNNNLIQIETNCRAELSGNNVLKLAEAFMQKGEFDYKLKEQINNKVIDISNGFRLRNWKTKKELNDLIKDEFEILSSDQNLSGSLYSKLNRILGLDEKGNVIKGKSGLENFQILTPYQAQYSGANMINEFIQNEFKKGVKYDLRKNLFKKTDKLIRTKNYYKDKKLVLSNGTLGFIDGDRFKEEFIYESAAGLGKMPFKEIRRPEQEFFELAYAVTVHKSQGSGFNHLFVVLPARYGLLSKELIYTALTRTKKSITIFIQELEEKSKNVLEIAQGRSFSASRRTSLMLDKPYRFYNLEPEKGVYVESRIELMIYHLLMKKRDEMGKEAFDFSYEEKPKEINIKTDFTIYVNNKVWYWEHLGLLNQRKYVWTWQNVKKKTYQDACIWGAVITTDESRGINPEKIEMLIDKLVKDNVDTEDKHKQYSNHHFYLR